MLICESFGKRDITSAMMGGECSKTVQVQRYCKIILKDKQTRKKPAVYLSVLGSHYRRGSFFAFFLLSSMYICITLFSFVMINTSSLTH